MLKLFISRLIFFYIMALLPLIYPGVAVSYDFSSFLGWFFLVPALTLPAYILRPPRARRLYGLLTATGVTLLYGSYFGWGDEHIFFSGAAAYAYLSTLLIFSGWSRAGTVAALEIFLPAFVFYRLLNFSRSAEEVFQASAAYIVPIFILSIAILLLHGLIIYSAAFNQRKQRKVEVLLFAAVATPLLTLMALLLPPDFMKHEIVPNRFLEEPPQHPLDGDGEDMRESDQAEQKRDESGLPLGGQPYPSPGREHGGDDPFADERRGGSGGGEGHERGGQLRGIEADRWNDGRGEGSGHGNQQHAVMIVASPIDPLYSAESYWNDFDERRGFFADPDDDYNRLRNAFLMEKWRNIEPLSDRMRKRYEIFYLSTIDARVIPYRPHELQPTRLNKTYFPFSLSYSAEAHISRSGPEEWRAIGRPANYNNSKLKRYLQLPLAPEKKRHFETHLQRALKGRKSYFARIEGILKSLSSYQYMLGFDEDTRPEKLVRFLTKTKQGDCTEFSHTAAMLGRLAGIPSRVVTGYIATHELQTRAHRRGLRMLWEQIKPLQQFPIDQLYLITSSHHHAWVQFYLPELGWVDFESTAFAIPPPPGFDPNELDVVIPIIEAEDAPQVAQKPKPFPWLDIARLLGGMVLLFMALLFGYRYGRELWLAIRARRKDSTGLEARYRLLQMRLAADGYPLRQSSQTPLEYADELPLCSEFAKLHTRLIFQENFQSGEREELLSEHRLVLQQTLKTARKSGLGGTLRRFVSLRGLYV